MPSLPRGRFPKDGKAQLRHGDSAYYYVDVYIDSKYITDTMREAEIRHTLETRLDKILPGAAVKWVSRGDRHRESDGTAELQVKGHLLRMTMEIVGQPNFARLREKCDLLRARARRTRGIPVLVAPFLNAELRAYCQNAGVQYLDLSGNVWLETPAVFIQKEAPKNLYPHQAKRRSPFADRASLILRFLSTDPHPMTLGQIVSATGLDSGYVSRIVRSAVDLRYAALDSDGRVRLVNQEEMLGDWAAGYTWRRNPCTTYFMKEPAESFPELLRAVLSRSPQSRCALTMHGGNNRVAPFTSYGIWHLYLEEPGLERDLVEGLHLERTPEDAGNVTLLTPYYRSSVFFNARLIEGLAVVSDLQLFLDLRHYPVRGGEASEEVLARRLRPKWSAR